MFPSRNNRSQSVFRGKEADEASLHYWRNRFAAFPIDAARFRTKVPVDKHTIISRNERLLDKIIFMKQNHTTESPPGPQERGLQCFISRVIALSCYRMISYCVMSLSWSTPHALVDFFDRSRKSQAAEPESSVLKHPTIQSWKLHGGSLKLHEIHGFGRNQ